MAKHDITCDHCGSTIEILTRTIAKEKSNSNFSHLKALLYDADRVRVTWSFDEQQADPIHNNFTITGLKDELRQLLAKNNVTTW